MNKKMQEVLSSYARSFVVAVMTAYAMGDMSVKDLLIAGLIAVAGPAIRAVNPKDPAFGMVADAVDVELNKLAKADKKKKK
jgi:hypothetical protein